MARARDILNESSHRKSRSLSSSLHLWYKTFEKSLLAKLNTGLSVGRTGYMVARYVGWFIVTTGIITALPLVMEVKRESIIEELENAQISSALAEGRTPQELAVAHFMSSLEP